MKKIIFGILIVSLGLVGCLTDDDYVVGSVEIKNSSDLFGVWRWVPQGVTGYLGDNTPNHYLVLNDSASYFMVYGSSKDASQNGGVNSRGSFTPNEIHWELRDSNILMCSPNGFRLYNETSRYRGLSYRTDQVRGFDSVKVKTYSDIDSLVLAINLLDSLTGEDYDEKWVHNSVDSMSYVIIQWKKDNATEQRNEQPGWAQIHVISEPCYRKYPDAENYKEKCLVSVYEKDNSLDIAGVLSQMDTISSTEEWEYLLKKYPEYMPISK
jgi:hypothetical protein